jgi:hypothetical protein
MSKRPGGELASRPLHFIWIADSSGSMEQDGKIQSLNTAIREAIPHMKKVAEDNPNAQVLVRAVKFSNGAQWHIAQPTPVADFGWTDLNAEGETDMGKALELVAEQLKMPPMSERALPPVLVLVSDGQPTDDFESGLKALMEQPVGQEGRAHRHLHRARRRSGSAAKVHRQFGTEAADGQQPGSPRQAHQMGVHSGLKIGLLARERRRYAGRSSGGSGGHAAGRGCPSPLPRARNPALLPVRRQRTTLPTIKRPLTTFGKEHTQ